MNQGVFKLATLLLQDVSQNMPMDGGLGMFFPYFWVVLLVLIVLIAMLLYRLFLPGLSKVKVTENLEKTVMKETSEESVVNATGSGEKAVERGSEVEAQEPPVDVALRLLEADERRVVEVLIEAGGSMLQKEISWKTGFSKVKTHRVLVRLVRRSIVVTEKYYNTNRITIAKWLLKK